MADQPGLQPGDAGQAPVPDAAPAPVPAPADVTPPQQPAQEAPVPPAAPKDPSGRAAELQAELAAIRAEALSGAKTLVRVLAPHVSFTHGGITVGTEPTLVPLHALGPLLTAADEAGVSIAEET